MKLILVSLLTLTVLTLQVRAEPTPLHALVIGNSEYKKGPLKNPTNDADLIRKTLADLGFEVTFHTNLNHKEMDNALNAFCRNLPKGGVSLFFYAGHGLQDKHSKNYLIPVDAELQSEASVKYQTLPVEYVTESLNDSKSNLKIIVLDCCRDNPFERSWGRGLASRGLANTEAPNGSIVAFATDNGDSASDGSGVNSPFTKNLAVALKQGAKEGKGVLEVFRDASRAVGREVNQKPHIHFDATMDEFYLSFSKSKQPSNSKPQIGDVENESFNKPRISESIEKFLADANDFSAERKFDRAIEAYTNVIVDTDSPPSVLGEARKGRGNAYLSRKSSVDDIGRAISDFKTIGENGVKLNILVDQANLRVENAMTAKVSKNEKVTVTERKGDWLWIHSVGGDESRRGWAQFSAFVTPIVNSNTVYNSSPINLSTNSQIQSTPIVQSPTPYPRPSDQYSQPIPSRQYTQNQPTKNMQSNQYSQPAQSRQYSQNQQSTMPRQSSTRPLNAFQTPEWESLDRAKEMKQEQQRWDRENRSK